MLRIQNRIYGSPGYHIIRGFFTEEDLLYCHYSIDNTPPKVTTLLTDTPWGYGDFKNDSRLTSTILRRVIETAIHDCSNDQPPRFNHVVINEKAPFYGPAVEWHQEMSNVATFASGASPQDWHSFLQVYISLDGEDSDNGGLRVFPNSHSLGYLEHIDYLSGVLTHKRTLPQHKLQSLTEEFGLRSLRLRPGDAVVFNSLLVHGSGSNASNRRRRSLVCQLQYGEIRENHNIFLEEVKHRKNFASKFLINRASEISGNKEIYSDIKRASRSDINA